MKRILYLSIVIVLILSMGFTVFATSVSDLNSKINKAENQLSSVKSEKSAAMNEVAELTDQISELEEQLIELNLKIDTLTIEIDQKKKDIEQKEKEFDERQALLNKRLVAVYTTGKTSYLDVLLSSSSITDFISNYYLISQLAECDSELLTQIQNLKTQIQNEKTELENNKIEVESTKVTIEASKSTLESTKAEKSAKLSSLTAEEKKLQAEIDAFEEDRKQMLSEVASNYSASYSSYSSTSSNSGAATSAGGFACPLAGRSRADITCGFYGYRNHGGCDFARNSKGSVEGLPVYASKSGVVEVSVAKINSSGNYYSYGEYIRINHQDGTSTLYAHMQPGSRRVYAGQYVSQGQQIGNVGATGHVTGPHLHFEIYVGGSRVDPANYLP